MMEVNKEERKIETLFETQWLSLKSVSNGNWKYIFSHESRCRGEIVAILPFRRNDNEDLEILLRSEFTPCWGEGIHLSSITGGIENNEVRATAIHELKEEAGYEIEDEELISLGTCRGTKSTDTIYHLFAVNVSKKTQTIAKGDGSELEARSFCCWQNSNDIVYAADPLAYVLFVKLEFKMNNLK